VTYLRFHLALVLPWVLAAFLGQLSAWAQSGVWGATAVTLAIVYAFTVPWDNWAVKRRIWDFPEDKFLFRILHLPIEEYAFFGLQSLMTIGLGLALEPHLPTLALDLPRPPIWATGFVALGWGLLGWKTWSWPGRFGRPAYAYHMLFWMLPVVVMQWVLGPDILGPRLPLIATVVAAVGTYLTLADVLAVRWGLWFFDDRQVTGPRLFRVLPWEEAVFFYLTTLLVIQSLLLWRAAFG